MCASTPVAVTVPVDESNKATVPFIGARIARRRLGETVHIPTDIGRSRTVHCLTACLISCCAIRCGAGDGHTLDERGRPFERPFVEGLGSRYGSAALEPNYESIALSFLEPLCADCHGGGAPSAGLDLTFARAFQEMVGVPSLQRPDLALVEPSAPDDSYLIIKLEGGDDMVGRRMPRGRPARTPDEIDVVRVWIADGARRN